MKSCKHYNVGIENPMYGKPSANGMLNKRHSEETKEKLRLTKLSESNPMWKGDDVDKGPALHAWVRRHLAKPELCQTCSLKKAFDLANITGVYNREFKNWKYLCRKCHMLSDGRIYNLKNQVRLA